MFFPSKKIASNLWSRGLVNAWRNEPFHQTLSKAWTQNVSQKTGKHQWSQPGFRGVIWINYSIVWYHINILSCFWTYICIWIICWCNIFYLILVTKSEVNTWRTCDLACNLPCPQCFTLRFSTWKLKIWTLLKKNTPQQKIHKRSPSICFKCWKLQMVARSMLSNSALYSLRGRDSCGVVWENMKVNKGFPS